MSWLIFFGGALLGALSGVTLMCVLAMSRDPLDVEGCTRNCDQGRSCDCKNEVHP